MGNGCEKALSDLTTIKTDTDKDRNPPGKGDGPDGKVDQGPDYEQRNQEQNPHQKETYDNGGPNIQPEPHDIQDDNEGDKVGVNAKIDAGFNPLPPGVQRPEKDTSKKRSDEETNKLMKGLSNNL